MISVTFTDGGTRPTIKDKVVPGMDRLTWVEVDYEEEYSWVSQRVPANEEMRRDDRVYVDPWPNGFTYHMPLDLTDKHETMTFRLDGHDQYYDDFAEVPAGSVAQQPEAQIDMTVREDTATTTELDMEEVQEWVGGGGWIHLPVGNVAGVGGHGGTNLQDALRIEWQGLDGASDYRLSLEDNDLFTPFDTGEADRYLFAAKDGPNLGESGACMWDGGEYMVHLRPRRWWVSAWCMARYVWVTGFEIAYDDVIFIVPFHCRPPVYPYRHDVYHSKQTAWIPNPWGDYMCYDPAIDFAFDNSRSAAVLRSEILKLEWFSWSSAYILQSVTPASLYTYTEIPQKGEISFGITHRDCGLDHSTVWAEQAADLSSVYPRNFIGTFYSDFFRRPGWV